MLFELADIRAEPLGHEHEAELQALMQRCSDFWELVSGQAPPADAASELLSELPPGKSAGDKLVIGFRDPGGLVAVADLIRGLRRADDWCLGLLLLDPRGRGRGLGRELFTALAHWCAGLGARSLCLVVQTQNRRALRFWSDLGFRVYATGRQRLGRLDSDVVKMELTSLTPAS